MRNHFGHVFSFIQKDCRISDPAAALKEGIYIVNVFKTKGRDRQNALPVKYEKYILFQACCPVTLYRILEKCVEILCLM